MRIITQTYPVFIRPIYRPWASTTIKIMVDPISMIKTLRVQQWWLYESTHCFNGGKGIPGEGFPITGAPVGIGVHCCLSPEGPGTVTRSNDFPTATTSSSESPAPRRSAAATPLRSERDVREVQTPTPGSSSTEAGGWDGGGVERL